MFPLKKKEIIRKLYSDQSLSQICYLIDYYLNRSFVTIVPQKYEKITQKSKKINSIYGTLILMNLRLANFLKLKKKLLKL